MAIPSFTDEDILNDYDTEYYADYVWSISVQMAWNVGFTYKTLEELREYVIEKGETENLINSDGTIDLSKARTPGLEYFAEYAKEGRVRIIGDPRYEPVYVGFIDGVFCIAYGVFAIPYINMASIAGPRQLITPNLMLVDFGPHKLTNVDGTGGSLQVVDFAASFMTTYGETQLSDPIQIGPLLDWTSITLAVVEEDIPVYATAVKYYRLFGEGSAAVYRLVGQVKVNGS